MTCCTTETRVYRWDCLDCMVRKIQHLRSQDKRLTVKLQRATFERMGPKMAACVKQKLKETP